MSNNIKHPSHYAEGRKYEPKDVIRDWGLNFNLGNAVKYISRAGRKDDIVQELKKAQEYLQFEIEAIEAEREKAPKHDCTHTHIPVTEEKAIPLDECISIGDLLNMGALGFSQMLKMTSTNLPRYLAVDGKGFVITDFGLEQCYGKKPLIQVQCRNKEYGALDITIRGR